MCQPCFIYLFIYMSYFNRVAPSVGKHCFSWRPCVQFTTINKKQTLNIHEQTIHRTV